MSQTTKKQNSMRIIDGSLPLEEDKTVYEEIFGKKKQSAIAGVLDNFK